MAANKYCELTPSKAINQDFQKITDGFTAVQVDTDTAKQRLDDQDSRINRIVGDAGSSNTEIVDARGGYPILSDRLDAVDQTVANLSTPDMYQPAPDASITPTGLTFIRSAVQRNFFNLKKTLSKLDLSTNINLTDTNMYPITNITSPGATITQDGDSLVITNNDSTEGSRQESVVRFGSLYPYSVIDVVVNEQVHTSYTANVNLHIMQDVNNRIIVAQRGSGSIDKTISLEVIKNGNQVFSDRIDGAPDAPYTIRVHVTGKYLHLLRVKDGITSYLKSYDISSYFDLRTVSLYKNFGLYVGARLGPLEHAKISGIEHYLTGGTGQADPKLLHYKDGTPIVQDNKIWFAMTARGYNDIPASSQAIYSLDLDTFDWALSGVMSFNLGGQIKQYHATDILYDDDTHEWYCFTTSHGDDHGIYAGKSNKDPRYGITIVPISKVNYTSVGNEEDPSIIYDKDANKWRMAYVKGTSGYNLYVAEANSWNGAYIDKYSTSTTSATGSLIQKIGGRRYVFIGRGLDILEAYSYPDLQLQGTLKLDVTPNSNNIWPVIFPLRNGYGTKYMLLTFDRGKVTGTYSYGALYLYEAKEVGSGTEYPIKKYPIAAY